MSDFLTSARAELVELVTAAGIPHVVDHVPERFSPPTAVLVERSPFLTRDDELPFGSWACNWTVLVIAGRGTNSATTKALDGWSATLADHLDAHGWPTDVDSYYEITANGATYFVARLNTSITTDTLTPQEA